MSEMRVDRQETQQFSDEAKQFATGLVSHIKSALDEDMPMTGHSPTDVCTAHLRELDRQMQTSVDAAGFVYFGHTREINPYLYDALYAGYNPSSAQLRAQEEENGHNFLWDEVTELFHEHPDIYELYASYGYGSDKTPMAMPYVGAYALPEKTLTDVIAAMFERGREYRALGYGFPYWSDDIPGDVESEPGA